MKSAEFVWAVSRVWRGFATEVELFASEEAAMERSEQIRGEIPVDDDVNVFRVALPSEFARTTA